MELNGTTTLVIGGSGAMGAATARRVHDLGGTVALVGRNRTKLDQIAAHLGGCRVFVGDFGDATVAAALVDEIGEVDHVVAATSAGPVAASSVVRTDLANFKLAHGRLWATYNVVHLAPHLVRRGGSVTLVSGSSSRRPGPGFGVWTSVHGAIEALARAAALELAPTRVNVVSPGGIGMRPDRQLVERSGVADDIGRAIVSLITNNAITNAVLDVDSGERLGTWPDP